MIPLLHLYILLERGKWFPLLCTHLFASAYFQGIDNVCEADDKYRQKKMVIKSTHINITITTLSNQSSMIHSWIPSWIHMVSWLHHLWEGSQVKWLLYETIQFASSNFISQGSFSTRAVLSTCMYYNFIWGHFLVHSFLIWRTLFCFAHERLLEKRTKHLHCLPIKL